ncbi:MAG: ABC transporter substrate-binding protein [Betaproteobacteria bacterium]|nr:ABC transporter substrate-binding protein [Betaproteobacteria bacterium]
MKMASWLRQFIKDLATTAIVPVTIVIIVAIVGLHYVEPAPPSRITISTSREEGAYNTVAARYRDILARDGVTLELRGSEGAVENLARLKDPNSGVDLGFVQGGLTSEAATPELMSLGSLYYEPLWIFYRGSHRYMRLGELKGKRVAVGREGGGTRLLSLRLLDASGVNSGNSSLLSLSGDQAADALLEGKADVAMFVAAPEDPLIGKLLRDARVRPMSLDQAEATVRQFPFLHRLLLPHGAIDLGANIPEQDVELVAPTATLVARESLHPALVYLLLQAATEVHGGPGLFRKEHDFPADRDIDLDLSTQAERFYKSGPPFLHRVLPYWLATLIDRMAVLLIPLIAVLVPATRIIPAIYSWRVRARVYRWYGELSFLEAEVRKNTTPKDRAAQLRKLDEIEERVNRIRLPLAFAHHLYVLREHIDLVRRRMGGRG